MSPGGGLAPAPEELCDAFRRPHESEVVDQVVGDGRGGVASLAGEIEILDLGCCVPVTDRPRVIGVEIPFAVAHPADVERELLADRPAAGLQVIPYDERDIGDDVELGEAFAAARCRESPG